MLNVWHRSFRALVTLLCCASCSFALAQNQTADTTPVQDASSLPYQIGLQRYDFGAASLPTLQSFAAGVYDGKWVLLAGRTNGLHGFTSVGSQNFPTAFANKEVWVIDPVNKQSWHRSLDTDLTVTAQQLAELSSTNTEYAQLGNRLYVVGGYGSAATGSGFTTQSSLTAIDLPGMVNWVMTGAGSANSNMRVVRNSSFRVTGGAMYELNGKMQLVFGQNFLGGYTPGSEGAYTSQIRSFNIVDDGTTLNFSNLASTPADPNYHRRDLNVFPTVVRNPDNSLGRGIVALSGVFTDNDGAWTVPVVVDGNGNPSMADPNSPGTFKQGMNGYHSAKLGMFSEATGQMHEVLFGGISLQYHDSATNTFVTDNNLPFINDITSVRIDSAGNFSQHLLGEFPQILDMDGNRLRFGANAEFFLANGIPTYDNGVLKLDALTEPTTLGYIFGGLFANAPHTRNVAGAVSGASDEIFEVIFTPVPEPVTYVLMLTGAAALLLRRLAGRDEIRGWHPSRYRGPRMQITLKCLVVVALSSVLSSARAATAWNETTNGDLSGDHANPTNVILSSGTNSVYCTFGPSDIDQDYLHIHVPAGRKFTGLVLASYMSDDSIAFVGLQSGSTMTFGPDEAFVRTEEMLGFSHIGPGDGNAVAGTDILPFLGTAPTEFGFPTVAFTPPLPSGDYTFWFQQLGAPTSVQLNYMVSNLVPGDFNLDGTLTKADINAMLVALTDLNKFKSDNGLSDADLLTLGDLNSAGGVTNSDIQSLLNTLSGAGSGISPVPEPTSFVMLALSIPALIVANRRSGRSPR